MIVPLLVTLGFLPIYLWIRAPYRRLPLHCDTGFYVSNHTVSTGRWRFARGWNARFAGCSKAVPEFVYSLVYLFAERSKVGPQGRIQYKSMSRLVASLYNYSTAILAGCAAWQWGGDAWHYCAGLVVCGLMTSEPQYGVYFECGELFEMPFDVGSVLLLAIGASGGGNGWFAAAAFVWMLGACFVKLSAAVSFCVLFGLVLLAWPQTWAAVAMGSTAALCLFGVWVRVNGRTLRSLAGPLVRHESAYGQRAQWRVVRNRAREKGRCLWRTIRTQPVFPALTAAAFVIMTPHPLVLWYGLAVLVAFVVQAADCWYYQMPLLPAAALIVTGMVATGSDGMLLLALGVGWWIACNTARSRRADVAQVNAGAWAGHRPFRELARDIELDRAAEVLRPEIQGRSVLVYGPLNQAYVLLSASYDTPIVTPEWYLDEMAPGWQWELNARILLSPPHFVLDTGQCFDAAAMRGPMGLDYRLRREFPGLRWFELIAIQPPSSAALDVLTHRPLSDVALAGERVPDGGTAHAGGVPSTVAGDSAGEVDPTAKRLELLLLEIAEQGFRRLGIYGAGRFTARHFDAYHRSPVPVVALFDDRPTESAARLYPWPVERPTGAWRHDIDVIVLSTDRFATVLRERVSEVFGGDMPVFSIGQEPASHGGRGAPVRPLISAID